MHLPIEMLTGDAASTAKAVGNQLNISSQHANLMPEDKQNIVKQCPQSLMIGDGANDANALASSFVSIAVQGSLEVSFRCADVYLVQPGIQPVPRLIELAKKTRATVKRNLIISIIYNAFGITGALLGWVTPLIAAVIMPISSITVLISSLLGVQLDRKRVLWK